MFLASGLWPAAAPGWEQVLGGVLTLACAGQPVGQEEFQLLKANGSYWPIWMGKLSTPAGESNWQTRVPAHPLGIRTQREHLYKPHCDPSHVVRITTGVLVGDISGREL